MGRDNHVRTTCVISSASFVRIIYEMHLIDGQAGLCCKAVAKASAREFPYHSSIAVVSSRWREVANANAPLSFFHVNIVRGGRDI